MCYLPAVSLVLAWGVGYYPHGAQSLRDAGGAVLGRHH